MASNSFGNIFRITTWGESHGKAMGVVIDGCPSGIKLSESDIMQELIHRSPGRSIYTSPRKENDQAQILSGVFEGKTTGSPLSIIIPNKDVDSSSYKDMRDKIRPGHANYTYFKKYGLVDFNGGGRASARETVCRVAAGAVALKILNPLNIEIIAYLNRVGEVSIEDDYLERDVSWKEICQSPLFLSQTEKSQEVQDYLTTIQEQGDSCGASS